MNHLANAARRAVSRRFTRAETRWAMWPVGKTIRNVYCGVMGIFLLSLAAVAQLTVGDNLHMNLNGNLGYTYGGGINGGVSDHSMGFMGNGVLTGNYYSPNFLNFNVDPFYNRQQSNTIYGSLTNASGVSSNVNLFSGSHFPGTFAFNRVFNSTGAFGVPGSDLGLAQHVNTQTYGIGWSALLPGLPTLTANYNVSSTSQQILDESGNDREKDRSLILLSNYRWDGFIMAGQFQHRNTDATFSQFLLPGEAAIDTQSSSNSYAASVQHALPMTGNASVSWNRLDYSYHYLDSVEAKNSGSSDTINSNATFHPTNKLGVGFSANYNDSLLGSIPETVLNSGTPVNLTGASTFHSVLVGSDVFYQIMKNLGVHADIAHQRQSFLGNTYDATQFGGSANFNFDRSLLKGLSFSLGVVDTAQQQSNTGLGFVGNLNYTHRFFGWDVNGNFSYSQNVQTVMLVYTTSSYSYLASVRRRIGERKYFMVGYSGAHSGITADSGTTSSADRIWTGFIFRGNSFNAYYNKSNGLAIFTPTGLVPVPTNLPPAVLGTGFTSYDSHGWGVSAGTVPVKRLTLSFAYAKSSGSTIDPLQSIYSNNTLINAVMQYRMRKIYLNGGYTRLQQTAGLLGAQPLDVTTYYIGFSRWFNFF